MQWRSAPFVSAIIILLVLAQVDQNGEARNFFRSIRAKFRIERLVDFSSFKNLFHKSYGSISEELVRQKLYIARATRAFVSEFAYKHRKSTYYLSVNPMSDWTDAELARLDTYKTPEDFYAISNRDEKEEPDPKSRRKRSLFFSKRKLRRGTSFKPVPIPFQPVSRVTRIPIMNSIRVQTAPVVPVESSDTLYIDHRSSNCFQPVQNQGKCGSCYAFAAAAFFEWFLCKETKRPIKLSEQYIIDCGPETKLKYDLDGCSGGSAEGVAEFLAKHGAELAHSYPYVASEGKCPYDRAEPLNMGYLRLGSKAAKGVKVDISKWDYYLKFAPIIVGIATSKDFREYGGGVHIAKDCCVGRPKEECGGHGMLLVGHGTDSGEDYWLMRNSYSDKWGELGYYRLSKRADCVQRNYGLIFATSDGQSLGLNLELNKNRSIKVENRIKDLNRYSLKINPRG